MASVKTYSLKGKAGTAIKLPVQFETAYRPDIIKRAVLSVQSLKFVPDLIEAGIDALHPIEPEAMDIFSVRKQFGAGLCLIGNVDVGSVLIEGTREDVRREVERLVSFFSDQGGFVLSSDNSVPPNVPIENFKALIDPESRTCRA